MEENIIVKSKHINFWLIKWILILLPAGAMWFGLFMHVIASNISNFRIKYQWMVDLSRFAGKKGMVFFSIKDAILHPSVSMVGTFIDIGFLALIVCIIISIWLFSYEMRVTDKKIYGKSSFGKKVFIAKETIFDVEKSIFSGITVSTFSGDVVFRFIKNREDVYNAIKQLIEGKNKPSISPDDTLEFQNSKRDFVEELKKYKELLDDGIITQEDFDAKKKQLLGL